MIRKLFSKLKEKPLITAFLTLSSGALFSQLLGLLTTPIVSRIYDNKSYGEYSIFVSTATILCSFSQLGLASAIMIPEDEESAKKILTSSFLLQIVVVSFFLIIALILKPFYQLFTIGDSYIFLLILLAIYVFTINTVNYLNIYMNRKKYYRALFLNSIIGALSVLIITIPLGLLNFGFWGFIIASLISNIICIIQMFSKENPFIRVTIHDFRTVIKRYREFIMFQFPSNLLTSFSVQYPNQLYSRVFGNAALGSYSMAEKIFGIPSRLIAAPINTLYFKTAVDYKNDKNRLADFTLSLVTKVMIIAIIPLIILIFWGGDIFSFVLGDKWQEAGQISGILVLSYVFTFCSTCTSYCRVALEKQRSNLFYSVIQLVIIVVALTIGIKVQNTLISAILFYAIANSLVQIIDMCLNFYYMRRNLGRYMLFALVYFFIIGSFIVFKNLQ